LEKRELIQLAFVRTGHSPARSRTCNP
jgi:hypothetical protein